LEFENQKINLVCFVFRFTGNDWWDVLEYSGKYGMFKVPTAWWCGFYDIFQMPCLAGWEGAQYMSNDEVKGQNLITIDPLGHCQAAADFFKPHLIEGRTLLPIAQSLQLYGVRDVSRDFKDVTFYVMSSDDKAGNFWTTLDDFPVSQAKDFYLQDGGVLSETSSADSSDSSTSFVHDPSDPVPSQVFVTFGIKNSFLLLQTGRKQLGNSLWPS